MMNHPTTDQLCGLARQAGEIMKDNFAIGMNREIKDDRTPLTASDTAINELVIDTLSEFPMLDIIGEEKSRRVSGADYQILCDPVDGTIPFCRGIPISAFSIALLHRRSPIVSVIYDPFMDRMWYSDPYVGSFLNEDRISVSHHNDIANAHVSMCWWKEADYNLHSVSEALHQKNAGWNNLNSIAYAGALVACGEIDATIFPGRSGWETAAMQVLVEEAGGTVTDIFGNEMQYGANGEINGHIISNGLIHDELVETVRPCQ